jgi:hypothetical protein
MFIRHTLLVTAGTSHFPQSFYHGRASRQGLASIRTVRLAMLSSFSGGRASLAFFLVFCLAFLLCPAAAVQPPGTALRLPVAPLIRNAGYVFMGTVTAVQQAAPSHQNAVATVRITFRVDQGIQGVRAGQTLEIHEWAGLWQSGERYRPGERVLLFLYRPSRLGLTSSVGGSMGRFVVDSQGQIVLQPGQIPALSADPTVKSQLRGRVRISAEDLGRMVRRAER